MTDSVEEVSDERLARHATTKDEATHRFITHVRWGAGHFGDHYRYIVAASDEHALSFAREVGVYR